MIINTLNFLSNYKSLIENFDELDSFLKTNYHSLDVGSYIISDTLHVVKINYSYNPESMHLSLLEAHRDFLDLHITLKGIDEIVYKNINACNKVYKPYNEDGDYILYSDEFDGMVTIPENYFAIIEPSIAHMALMQKGDVSKLVLKFKRK
jgi:biofilm protein TabA